jgi:hypothetical protein
MNRMDNGLCNHRMNPLSALYASGPYEHHDQIQGLVPSAFGVSRIDVCPKIRVREAPLPGSASTPHRQSKE